MKKWKEIITKYQKVILIVTLIVILLCVDQISKAVVVQNRLESSIVVIPNVLNFSYVENTGGAFGIGQDSLITFIITNLVVLGVILRFMISQRNRIDKKTNIMLSLIIAGGTGNLIDRVFRGFVVDFIDISPLFSFPKFNLADCYIVIGWFLLALFVAGYTYKEVIQNRKKRGEK